MSKRVTNVYEVNGHYYLDYIHPVTKKRIRKSAKTTVKDKAVELFNKEFSAAYDQRYLGKESKMTVRQLMDWCWNNYWCFKPLANHKRKFLAITYMMEKFGNCVAAALTPDMLREYMRERMTNRKISTIKREFTHFSTAYAQAIKNKLLHENPFRMIESSMLNEDHLRRNRVATKEEIELLLGSCAGTIHKIIDFVLNTGLRKGEVENLKWSDVDFKHKRIATQTYKGGRRQPRNIPMLAGAERVLNTLPRDTEFVFTNHLGKKIPGDGMIHAQFPRIVARCGINDLTFHDLRHTFATHYYRREFNLRAVQMILGHKDPGTTQRYLNLTEADLVPAGNFDFGAVCHKNDTVDSVLIELQSEILDNHASAVSSVR